eukprot:scaffold2740_cov418-Prasinococcus_capsulatus_cf.AAC.2
MPSVSRTVNYRVLTVGRASKPTGGSGAAGTRMHRPAPASIGRRAMLSAATLLVAGTARPAAACPSGLKQKTRLRAPPTRNSSNWSPHCGVLQGG